MLEDQEPRRINPLLMIGLVSMPAIFVWFLLLRGYARSTRNAALAYASGPSLLMLLTVPIDYLIKRW